MVPRTLATVVVLLVGLAFPRATAHANRTVAANCTRWKMVETFPDLTIQFVTAFPDLKIKYVSAFPGLP